MSVCISEEGRWRVVLYEGAYNDYSIVRDDIILIEMRFKSRIKPVWNLRLKLGGDDPLDFMVAALRVAKMLNPSFAEMGAIICNLVKEQHERERASTAG